MFDYYNLTLSSRVNLDRIGILGNQSERKGYKLADSDSLLQH